jgi:hypothetical protein
MRFRLTGLFAAIFAIASLICSYQWLQTNTIFHFDSNAVLVLPDGRRFPTNRWVDCRIDMSFSFLCTDVKGEYLLIQNNETSKVAKVKLEDGIYEAVISQFKVRGPKYRGEYWIIQGKMAKQISTEVDIATEQCVAPKMRSLPIFEFRFVPASR